MNELKRNTIAGEIKRVAQNRMTGTQLSDSLLQKILTERHLHVGTHNVMVNSRLGVKLAMVDHASLHPAQRVSIFYFARQQCAIRVRNQAEGRSRRRLRRANLLCVQGFGKPTNCRILEKLMQCKQQPALTRKRDDLDAPNRISTEGKIVVINSYP